MRRSRYTQCFLLSSFLFPQPHYSTLMVVIRSSYKSLFFRVEGASTQPFYPAFFHSISVFPFFISIFCFRFPCREFPSVDRLGV
ncbi:hypothetical protein BT69DRAFT_1054361 [Atractiella rhizophila]|nr:hypothetical protein BT69DRAFT_1054361 [Atractiella rhizophila]